MSLKIGQIGVLTNIITCAIRLAYVGNLEREAAEARLRHDTARLTFLTPEEAAQGSPGG